MAHFKIKHGDETLNFNVVETKAQEVSKNHNEKYSHLTKPHKLSS